MRKTVDTGYPFDAIIVLGGNIRRTDTGYASSTYNDSDQFGMLGGRVRVIAAACMYLQGQASIFVFSTGTSEKTKAAFGPDVPTEAEVYSREFKALLDEQRLKLSEAEQLEPPTVILEDRSQNTVTNIEEIFAIIRAHPWKRVAIITAKHHLRRVEAICQLISVQNPIDAGLTFVDAEEVVKKMLPGKYDAEIETAYASEKAKLRLENEAKGIEHIKNGAYVKSEFQLKVQK